MILVQIMKLLKHSEQSSISKSEELAPVWMQQQSGRKRACSVTEQIPIKDNG